MDLAQEQRIELIVVSLERALERRRSVEMQLNQTGLKWSYLDAVDGRKPIDLSNYNSVKRISINGRDMSTCEIACFLSHRLVWERIVETNKTTLILEDDFLLLSRLDEVLQIAIDNSNAFDILRFQGTPASRYKPVMTYGRWTLVKHHREPRCTAGYIVLPHSAECLLKNSTSFYMPVDDYIATTWLHRLSILSLLPYPIGVISCQTTINDKSQERLSLYRRISKEFHKFPDGWCDGAYRTWTYLRSNSRDIRRAHDIDNHRRPGH
jgi:glycosyl transferase family 25